MKRGSALFWMSKRHRRHSSPSRVGGGAEGAKEEQTKKGLKEELLEAQPEEKELLLFFCDRQLQVTQSRLRMSEGHAL